MVGGTGVEPATTWMSTKRSTTELPAYRMTYTKYHMFFCQTFIEFSRACLLLGHYTFPHAKIPNGPRF